MVGYGHGAAGLGGTGFQLIIVILMGLFGVSFGQLLGAVSPSVQVSHWLAPLFPSNLTAL
jgi:hypothetical protein